MLRVQGHHLNTPINPATVASTDKSHWVSSELRAKSLSLRVVNSRLGSIFSVFSEKTAAEQSVLPAAADAVSPITYARPLVD